MDKDDQGKKEKTPKTERKPQAKKGKAGAQNKKNGAEKQGGSKRAKTPVSIDSAPANSHEHIRQIVSGDLESPDVETSKADDLNISDTETSKVDDLSISDTETSKVDDLNISDTETAKADDSNAADIGSSKTEASTGRKAAEDVVIDAAAEKVPDAKAASVVSSADATAIESVATEDEGRTAQKGKMQKSVSQSQGGRRAKSSGTGPAKADDLNVADKGLVKADDSIVVDAGSSNAETATELKAAEDVAIEAAGDVAIEAAGERTPDAKAASVVSDADIKAVEVGEKRKPADETAAAAAKPVGKTVSTQRKAKQKQAFWARATAFPFVKRPENKRKERKKKKLGIAGIIVRSFFSVLTVAILGVMIYGANYLYNFINELPKHDMAEIEASLKTMSTIYDDQGTKIKDIYIADSMRELVTYEELPKNLINAMVSIEDKTFWSHKGFNVTRIIGALYESYVSGGQIEGTSTITQQLARNIWLLETRSDYDLERKMKEAVFARELEENLTKEEIITHYMNMVALGNHSYGVKSAARLYFNKELNQLDILECAALAALTQSPSQHSMITTVLPAEVSADDPDILLATDEYVFLYNEDALPRIHTVLGLMYEQGYIDRAQYEHALNDDLRGHLHPQPLQTSGDESFFIDWMINDVAEDISLKYPEEFPTVDDALQLVYSGGLEIHSTFSARLQNIATEEFENPANYPLAYMNRDGQGNIIGEEREIVLFYYDNMFADGADAEGGPEQAVAENDSEAAQTKYDLAGIGDPWFFLNEEDFEILPNGGMRIFAGDDKRLGIYETSGSWGEDISVEFKDFYTMPAGSFYIVKGGSINIPSAYKTMDAQGNLILSPEFFASDENVFTIRPFEPDWEGNAVVSENGAQGTYWIDPDHFTLDQPVIQPQGATTIIEHNTGQVKAMVGGRGIEGSMQYNRALAPRQPGSTMKPLGVYAPAIQKSAEGLPVAYPDESLGEYWTAASVINDEPMEYEGRVWPNNWYGNYRGPQTMRRAIEQSINVCAVRAQLAVGNKRSVDFLKQLGITTIVEDGIVNDLNPSALALGGMTHGISPLENASAYGTFANGGVHVDPIGYTVVKFRNGEILLDGTPRSAEVMDSGAAFIMQDMLRTAVSSGIASTARVSGVPVGGKTGTSSEQVDAWFSGFTPKYVASVWVGIDVKMRMSQNSAAAARLFSKIMTRVYEEEEPGEFLDVPSNVERGYVSGISDYFIDGTKPDHLVYGDLVCLESNALATPDCLLTERRVVRTLNGGGGWYCPMHNPNPSRYPVDPGPGG